MPIVQPFPALHAGAPFPGQQLCCRDPLAQPQAIPDPHCRMPMLRTLQTRRAPLWVCLMVTQGQFAPSTAADPSRPACGRCTQGQGWEQGQGCATGRGWAPDVGVDRGQAADGHRHGDGRGLGLGRCRVSLVSVIRSVGLWKGTRGAARDWTGPGASSWIMYQRE